MVPSSSLYSHICAELSRSLFSWLWRDWHAPPYLVVLPLDRNVWDAVNILGKSPLPDPTIALLNQKTTEPTKDAIEPLLQIITAARQMVSKVWKTSKLCIAKSKNKLTQDIVTQIHKAVESMDRTCFTPRL